MAKKDVRWTSARNQSLAQCTVGLCSECCPGLWCQSTP